MEDEGVLRLGREGGWRAPERPGYKGVHGMGVPDGEKR
jgi:hypothetical protein